MNFKLNFKTEGRPNRMGRFQFLHHCPFRGVALRFRHFPASQMLILDGGGLLIDLWSLAESKKSATTPQQMSWVAALEMLFRMCI